MKANDLIRLIFKEDLRNDSCGIAEGADIMKIGIRLYFGLPFSISAIDRTVCYFYRYGCLNDELTPLPMYDNILYNGVGNDCCYLWKIQN